MTTLTRTPRESKDLNPIEIPLGKEPSTDPSMPRVQSNPGRTSMAKIFVVEDNQGIQETLVSYLELDGHQVKSFSKLSGVLEALDMHDPDLLILDVMLPDGDGFLFARRLRTHSAIPIIFLTARTSESDRITGLEIGGDDYVVKPFSTKELMLRVKAVLTRTRSGNLQPKNHRSIWKLDPGQGITSQLIVDVTSHSANIDGSPMELTGAEWKILVYLSEYPGMVLSREKILGACLDYMAEGSERTIDTHIKNLRSKLKHPDWIETVRGFGYRFVGIAQ